jgi:hypothetical protein
VCFVEEVLGETVMKEVMRLPCRKNLEASTKE